MVSHLCSFVSCNAASNGAYFPRKPGEPTFLNVGDEEQREVLERLTLQPALSFDFFGEDFTYRYTKQLEHPFHMRRDLAELARLARDYWDSLPPSGRDFDRAKAEFQRRFPL